MDYASLIHQLFRLNRLPGKRWGIETTQTLAELTGLPQYRFPAVHVAGTNGKGSVCTKVAVGLQSAGKRVGLFTSPHISTWRERILVNGEMISIPDAERLLSLLLTLSRRHFLNASFFELTTVAALLYFAEQNVDYAVIETGLGGRLDATRIVSPCITAITSISLDHCHLLGNTIEAIAREKAGILKPGVPAVVGPRTPQKLLISKAMRMGCPYTCLPPQEGSTEQENNRIAEAIMHHLSLSNDAIQAGLLACPPCRMETYNKEDLKSYALPNPPHAMIFDVAHNPDGLHRLAAALNHSYPNTKKTVLCALSKEKDSERCTEEINAFTDALYLVEAPNGRSSDAHALKKIFQKQKNAPQNIQCISSIEDAFHEACITAGNEGIVVVCGSFFIMDAAKRALGIPLESDPLPMNERPSTYASPVPNFFSIRK